MKRNYELYECNECLGKNFAAKAADLYESGQSYNSYLFATKLPNSIDFVECKAFRAKFALFV